MEQLEKILGTISNWAWGWPMLALLLGTHIFLTFRLRLIQRYMPKAIKLSVTRDVDSPGDISQFGALTTALAATIGTGNIIGVSTAVAAGGPGAVLWMWLTGVFGISTKYTEALLAVKYRVQNEEGMSAGGPMYVLERGLGLKWLGMIFAAFTVLASFGIGNMVQANAMAGSLLNTVELPPWLTGMEDPIGLPRWITGLVLAVLVGVVILGGIKSIARVCERLVPFMAIAYVGGCIIILALSLPQLPETIWLIVSDAFSGTAAVGGFLGAGMKEAVRFGIARGLFSNESGLGSAPIVAAAAKTRNPVRQALVSASGTFWDTVVICLITGLVVVSSGAWQEGYDGSKLTHAAFERLPYLGAWILNIGLLTFVFSTILGWSYYGEKACEYLLGRRAVLPYRVMWVIAVMVGATSTLNIVWAFSDIANALMAVPNLIAVLLLSGVAVAETRKYLWEDNLDAVDEESRLDPPPAQEDR